MRRGGGKTDGIFSHFRSNRNGEHIENRCYTTAFLHKHCHFCCLILELGRCIRRRRLDQCFSTTSPQPLVSVASDAALRYAVVCGTVLAVSSLVMVEKRWPRQSVLWFLFQSHKRRREKTKRTFPFYYPVCMVKMELLKPMFCLLNECSIY